MHPVHWFAAVIAVLSLAASGCARPPAAAEMGFTHPVWTNDGLYLVERNGPGALFLTPPPLSLDEYFWAILHSVAFRMM